jgi:hypothetical protein
MTHKLSFLASLLLLSAACLFSGCQNYTCEGACGQYYLSSEGSCGRPSILSDGTTSQSAFDKCTKDCTDALYNTANEESDELDSGNRWALSSVSDAEKFINCVAEQDYSAEAFNQTCADLDYSCTWFRW